MSMHQHIGRMMQEAQDEYDAKEKLKTQNMSKEMYPTEKVKKKMAKNRKKAQKLKAKMIKAEVKLYIDNEVCNPNSPEEALNHQIADMLEVNGILGDMDPATRTRDQMIKYVAHLRFLADTFFDEIMDEQYTG